MRALLKRFKPSLFFIIFSLIFVSAFVIRTYHIDLRPFHNDEGVNYFFFQNTRANGYYNYSHLNYHGPSYFYLSTFLTNPSIFGTSEFGVRSSAIFVGLLSILLLLSLRRLEGNAFTLLAAFLVTVSSSLVFYSRYAIHETLFVFSGVWLAISLYSWWRTGKVSSIYQGGVALGILMATKETFIITLFCIFLAFLSLGKYKTSFLRLHSQWQHVLSALLITVFIIAFTFTGGFRWMNGLREMFLAVPQWVGRNTSDVGHFKSYWYYIEMMFGPQPREFASWLFNVDLGEKIHLKFTSRTEFQLIGIALIPILVGLFYVFVKYFQKDNVVPALNNWCSKIKKSWLEASFFRFCFVWGILALLVYSYVDYKTPWLIISITFPLNLALACVLSHLFKVYGKLLGIVLSIPFILISTYMMWQYNFRAGYEFGDRNPYSYTHTSKGMLEVAKMIDDYKVKNPNVRILVGTKSYWPLPYYLRGYGMLGYEHTTDLNSRKDRYDVMIVDSTLKWKEKGWSDCVYRRISDVQEACVYFRKVDKK